MPGCESILAVTAGRLICVCGFCLSVSEAEKSNVWWFLGMKDFWTYSKDEFRSSNKSCKISVSHIILKQCLVTGKGEFDSCIFKAIINYICTPEWNLKRSRVLR